MTEDQLGPRQRNAIARRARKAEHEVKMTVWAQQWCPIDHHTWASKARCLWSTKTVVGEGKYAAWHPGRRTEIRLWATPADLRQEPPGTQVVVLQKGPHRKARTS